MTHDKKSGRPAKPASAKRANRLFDGMADRLEKAGQASDLIRAREG